MRIQIITLPVLGSWGAIGVVLLLILFQGGLAANILFEYLLCAGGLTALVGIGVYVSGEKSLGAQIFGFGVGLAILWLVMIILMIVALLWLIGIALATS